MIRKLIIFCISISLSSCCVEEKIDNSSPTKVSLLTPTNALLCVKNEVTFSWNKATDLDKDKLLYEVVIANNRALTEVVRTEQVSDTSITLTLGKGIAYYWKVTSVDSNGNKGDASETYAFYTKGDGVKNSVPFTAELVSPKKEDGNVSGTTITLKWKGTDAVDSEDILKYDLYFGKNSNPALKESGLGTESFDVSVMSGKTYYWRVDTINSTNSKSEGQVWSFTVN